MKYILDFDGVIFNVQALKEKMAELGIGESFRCKETFEEIALKDPAFDIRALVFSDALLFLNEHAHDCEIVSSYVSISQVHTEPIDVQRAYQEAKILRSGVTEILGSHKVHVVGKSKKEMLRELKVRFDLEGVECVFIDDRKEYIEEASDLGITALLMDKSPTRKSSPFVICSFEELNASV